MAFYDTADLLARCKRDLNRPDSDEAITDAHWYAFMSEAQQEAFWYLAGRVPEALVGSPAQLTAAGDNKTFTFGTDVDGANVVPLALALYRTLAEIPDAPLVEGIDFLMEGSRIRIPNDRTMSPAPYGQWVSPPNVINASTEPTLLKPARALIASGAVAKAAAKRLKQDPGPYLDQYKSDMVSLLVVLRAQVYTQGALRVAANWDWTRGMADSGSR